jgi:hypothetical protein
MPYIIVLVSPAGEIKLETQGFMGTSCQQASQQLEQSLGVKTEDQPTAEYFQAVSADQELQQF